MPRKPWFRRLMDAVVSGVRRVERIFETDADKEQLRKRPAPGPPRKPQPTQRRKPPPEPEPPSRFYPPEPIPPWEPETRSSYADAFDRIMGWFPDDGHYEQTVRTRPTPHGGKLKHDSEYHSTQGVSAAPAHPTRVREMLRALTPEERFAILRMSREEFQALARANPDKYKYH